MPTQDEIAFREAAFEQCVSRPLSAELQRVIGAENTLRDTFRTLREADSHLAVVYLRELFELAVQVGRNAAEHDRVAELGMLAKKRSARRRF